MKEDSWLLLLFMFTLIGGVLGAALTTGAEIPKHLPDIIDAWTRYQREKTSRAIRELNQKIGVSDEI